MLSTFVLSAALTLTGAAWWVFVTNPSDWWLDQVGRSFTVGCVAFVVAGAVTVGVGWLADRWFHHSGVFRCYACGRTLRTNVPCVCLPAEFLRKPLPIDRFRHIRRASPSVIWTIVLAAPLVLWFASKRPIGSFWPNVVETYAILFFSVSTLFGGLIEALQQVKKIRRFCLRWKPFLHLAAMITLILVFACAVLSIS